MSVSFSALPDGTIKFIASQLKPTDIHNLRHTDWRCYNILKSTMDEARAQCLEQANKQIQQMMRINC